jgi:hypothetical protein
MRHFAIPLLALALSLPAPAAAFAQQSVSVDEGTFTIMRGGTRIGREEFSIRRNPSPGGDVLVASATVTLTDQRLSPALRTDSAGAPLAYQLEVRVGNEVQERLTGQIGRGRFSARVRTPRGESAREYIVSDGALVLDDDVFHQYYFLAASQRTGSVPVVIPRRNVQQSMRVESAGSDRVTIRGVDIQARRLVLTEPDGAVRQIWVDSEGRVLRVSLDARGIIATRDEAPR